MREPAESLIQKFQNEILEEIARGVTLKDVALLACRKVETLAPGVICTFIRVRQGQLHPIAAPSLPASYSEQLEGVAIGPDRGSCGTAAWIGAPVEVQSIASDPLWERTRAMPLSLGLAACWSSPVMATDGSALATFALYYREERGPTMFERQLVNAFTHLSAIVIERSDAADAAHRLATYDQLTELPNRRSFDAVIGASCVCPASSFALLIVGVERLVLLDVDIEDLSSERLLREIAHQLRTLGPGTSAFSLGGGLFAVLVQPCADHEHLQRVGLGVLSTLQQPREWLLGAADPGISLGGALFGADGTTPEMLRQNAELARASARSDLHSGYASFQPRMRTAALRRRAVLFEVETALAEGRVVPHYQPVVRIDSGRIVGLEALLRMRRLDGSIVAAGEFQQVFGDPRLARKLTDRMLAEVARDAAGWLALGIDFGHVGINVAPVDFVGDEFGPRLQAVVDKAGLPISRIVVEITEMISMDDPKHNAADFVENLRQRGVRVALDDFGTGFASLTHLLSFPSDIIKIDRSFVARLLTDPGSAVIVQSLVEIALKLGKRVVAEGIETQAQADRLIDFGCTLGQGYLFARPADVEVTTRRLMGELASATN